MDLRKGFRVEPGVRAGVATSAATASLRRPARSARRPIGGATRSAERRRADRAQAPPRSGPEAARPRRGRHHRGCAGRGSREAQDGAGCGPVGAGIGASLRPDRAPITRGLCSSSGCPWHWWRAARLRLERWRWIRDPSAPVVAGMVAWARTHVTPLRTVAVVCSARRSRPGGLAVHRLPRRRGRRRPVCGGGRDRGARAADRPRGDRRRRTST